MISTATRRSPASWRRWSVSVIRSKEAVSRHGARHYAHERSLRPRRRADCFDASSFLATVPRIPKHLKIARLLWRKRCSGRGSSMTKAMQVNARLQAPCPRKTPFVETVMHRGQPEPTFYHSVIARRAVEKPVSAFSPGAQKRRTGPRSSAIRFRRAVGFFCDQLAMSRAAASPASTVFPTSAPTPRTVLAQAEIASEPRRSVISVARRRVIVKGSSKRRCTPTRLSCICSHVQRNHPLRTPHGSASSPPKFAALAKRLPPRASKPMRDALNHT